MISATYFNSFMQHTSKTICKVLRYREWYNVEMNVQSTSIPVLKMLHNQTSSLHTLEIVTALFYNIAIKRSIL